MVHDRRREVALSRAGEVWELNVLPQGTCLVVLLGWTVTDTKERELPVALAIWSEISFVPVGDVGPWDPAYFEKRHDTRRIA